MNSNVEPSLSSAIELAALWRDLTAGRVRFESSAAEPDYFRAQFVPTDKPSTVSEIRWSDTLLRLLLGATTKQIAIESGQSSSSIAIGCRRTLQNMGIDRTGTLVVPFVIVVAATAHNKIGQSEALSSTPLQLCVPFPRSQLVTSLTPREQHLFKMMCDGLSYQEMAKVTSASPRTVANYLAGIFRKCQTSGRNELIASAARAALDAICNQ